MPSRVSTDEAPTRNPAARSLALAALGAAFVREPQPRSSKPDYVEAELEVVEATADTARRGSGGHA